MSARRDRQVGREMEHYGLGVWPTRTIRNDSSLCEATFPTSIARDAQLVDDLHARAGVIFNLHAGDGGNAFGVPFRNKDGVSQVGLEIDHAAIGHSDAEDDALRKRDPQKLLSTVDERNLQSLTEQENRNFIETIRAENEAMWNAAATQVPAPLNRTP
jgi:hypothetical protein